MKIGSQKLGFLCCAMILIALFSLKMLRGDQIQIKESSNIGLLGDGYLSGVGLGDALSFADLLQRDLEVRVLAYVEEDMTSKGALATFKEQQQVSKVDLLIVSLGVADLKEKIPLQETLQNLEELLKEADKNGVRILYLAISPPFVGDNWMMSIKQLLDQFPRVDYISIMDGLWPNPEFMLDEWYPNARGHQKIANQLIPLFSKD